MPPNVLDRACREWCWFAVAAREAVHGEEGFALDRVDRRSFEAVGDEIGAVPDLVDHRPIGQRIERRAPHFGIDDNGAATVSGPRPQADVEARAIRRPQTAPTDGICAPT